MKCFQVIVLGLVATFFAVDAIPVGKGRWIQRSSRVRAARSKGLETPSKLERNDGMVKRRAKMMEPRAGHHTTAKKTKFGRDSGLNIERGSSIARRDLRVRQWQQHSQWKTPKLAKKMTDSMKITKQKPEREAMGREETISKYGLRVVLDAEPVHVGIVRPNVKTNMRRLVTRSDDGVAGFVEVAIPVHGDSLAKNVAGLVYAPSSLNNETGFEVRMSEKQSTQFFLKKVGGANGSHQYQLQVPILDGSSLTPILQCITFALDPSAPLSLQKCLKGLPLVSDLPLISQLFSYDSKNGQLKPMYIAASNATDSTQNATTRTLSFVVHASSNSSEDQEAAKNLKGDLRSQVSKNVTAMNDEAVASATSTLDSTLPSASPASSNTFDVVAPGDTNTTEVDDGATTSVSDVSSPHVLLFFVPTHILEVSDANDDSTDSSVTDSSVPTATLPLPSPMMAAVTSMTASPSTTDWSSVAKTVSVSALGANAVVPTATPSISTTTSTAVQVSTSTTTSWAK